MHRRTSSLGLRFGSTLRLTTSADAGVDIYRVSRWLGHGSIAVTEKRYLGLFQQGSEDASAIDAIMSEEVAR